MNNVRILQLKPVQPELKVVLGIMECKEESEVYEELTSSFHKLLPKIMMRIRPKMAMCISSVTKEYSSELLPHESKVLYVIVTIGEEVHQLSQKLFQTGDYLSGMLVDAMADSCLFGLEEQLKAAVSLLAKEDGFGISHRFEAPIDIPMQMQQAAYHAVSAKRSLGMKMTSGYMLDPVKSLCQVFELSSNPLDHELEHDCSRCNRDNCSLRKMDEKKDKKEEVILTLKEEENTYQLRGKKGQLVTEVLEAARIYIPKPCGGKGRCKKCKIKVLEGQLPISAEEKTNLSPKEINEGVRLACKAVLSENVTITLLLTKEESFLILKDQEKKERTKKDQTFSFAIDIGTTTIAIALMSQERELVLNTHTCINHQRSYGADVISRMEASNNGKKEELRQSISTDLTKGMSELLEEYQLKKEQIKQVVISGNTTMIHLLCGYSCQTLGVYPFIPVSVSTQKITYQELFVQKETKPVLNADTQVILLPAFSAFVGGDIAAGIYATGMDISSRISLLVDLGTNGEMALGNKEKLFVSSTAAGPAFEGGNITFGTGSILGAIYQIEIINKQAQIKTIGNKTPTGICGTGIIAAVAQLFEAKLIDETGRMVEEYATTGYPLGEKENKELIVITQKDIREIQLAKSAIRAGIETLLLRYGVTWDEVDQVYLAGGFGYHIDIDQAISIGMLPAEVRNKVKAVGNTSLLGAEKIIKQNSEVNRLEKMTKSAVEIPLSMDLAFQEFYMNYMMFE